MDQDEVRASLSAASADAQRLLVTLGADIASIVDARRDSSTDDEHDPEGATLAYERSQADAMRSGALERLVEIQAAQERLERGAYGTCAVCGVQIPEARLALRPWATRCVEHAR